MRFFYLRDEHGHPIGCLASDLSADKTVIKFAVSVCNPLDQFKKTQSKHLAAGRIATDECRKIVVPENKGRVKSFILEVIARDHEYPQRARDAAKLWLKARTPKTTVETPVTDEQVGEPK